MAEGPFGANFTSELALKEALETLLSESYISQHELLLVVQKGYKFSILPVSLSFSKKGDFAAFPV